MEDFQVGNEIPELELPLISRLRRRVVKYKPQNTNGVKTLVGEALVAV